MNSKSRSTCIAFILGPPGGVGKGGNLRLLKLTLLLLACACPGLPGEGGGKDSRPSTGADTGLEHSDSAPDDSGRDDTGRSDSDSSADLDSDSSSHTADTAPEDTAWDLDDADAKLIGEDLEALAGRTVVGAGDVNGDGLNDMAIAATRGGPGMVYMVYSPVLGRYDLGESDGKLSCDGIDGVGLSTYLAPMAGGGDVNADGYADLLIGMPFSGDDDEGWTWLAMGPIEGESDLLDMDATLIGVSIQDVSGAGVSWAGDMNEDGYDDVLIGASAADRAGVESSLGECAGSDEDDHGDEEGRAVGVTYVMLGPISGAVSLAEAHAQIYGEDGSDGAGSPVTGAGDLDGDGQVDLLIGATGNCERGIESGAAYVVLGPVSGDLALADADAKRAGSLRGDRAGDPLAVAGDVNGDGYPDLLVGAPDSDTLRGMVYLELGPVTGSQRLAYADATFTGEETAQLAGASLADAGDQNLDGYDDLLIGAPHEDSRSTTNGAAYLIFGPVTGTHSLADAESKWTAALGAAGISLANLGDTNADSLPDLLIGAYGDDEGGHNAGAAYLLLGGGPLLTHAIGGE